MKIRMRSNMNVYCAQLNNVHFCDVKQRLVGLHSTGCWGSVFVGLNQRLSPTSSQFLPTLQNQSLCLSSLNQNLSRWSQSPVTVHVRNQQSGTWGGLQYIGAGLQYIGAPKFYFQDSGKDWGGRALIKPGFVYHMMVQLMDWKPFVCRVSCSKIKQKHKFWTEGTPIYWSLGSNIMEPGLQYIGAH